MMGNARNSHERTEEFSTETGACTLNDGRCTEAASDRGVGNPPNGLDI